MKHYKHSILAAATALMALASCSEDLTVTPDLVSNNNETPENAISFATTVGQNRQTRAGQTGNYTTDFLKGFKNGTYSKDQAQVQGFGVFAYYTGTKTYGDYARYKSEGGQTNEAANFMFNQLVWWDNSATSNITQWTYSPVKYWPNEVQNGGGEWEVDDQNSNNGSDPATTDGANGGNVSFFAYAPYVGTLQASEKSGITAINKKTTLIGDEGANAQTTDPIITYKLPTGVDDDKAAVDLLWGTAGHNGTGVTGAANVGVQGDGNPGNDDETNRTYVQSILGTYRTNADLSKQTTGGTISFAFKHALAKIGGSYTGTEVGDDDDPNTVTHGLMVVLDIDDFKGAETGGQLEKYQGFPIETGSKEAWNKYNTKVTINEIVIDCSKELAEGKDPNDINFDYESTTYVSNIRNQGDLNLATGQWTTLTVSGATSYEQKIESSTVDPANATYGKTDTDKGKDAIISEELAEPATYASWAETKKYKKAGFESLPIGVTTVAKNVYETEANPMVFIPGTKPIIEFTITYTVRTYDPNLKNTYTEVKQKVKKRLYITKPVELNKQYNILMHLGLTSVKFDATVSDWDASDLTQGTIDETTTPKVIDTTTEDVEHVYLPINVGEAEDFSATVTVNSDNASNGSTTYAAVDGTNKTITLGSQPGKTALTPTDWTDYYVIADVTAPKATFDNEEKNVELSHVAITATDANGNAVDWVKGYYTEEKTPSSSRLTRAGEGTSKDPKQYKLQIVAKKNPEPTERKAKVYITYDNKSVVYTLTQKGVVISDNPTLTVKKGETELSEDYVSGIGAYTTVLKYKFKESDTNGNGYGNESEEKSTTEGYTLSEATSTGITITGTTFKTAPNKSGEKRDLKLKATYGGKETAAVEKEQAAASVESISITADKTSLTHKEGEVKLTVKATLKTTNDGDENTTTYSNVDVTTDAAKSATLTITTASTGATQKTGDNNKNIVTIAANNTPKNRNWTVVLNYKEKTSAAVTIKQDYAPITAEVKTSGDITTETFIETQAKVGETELTYGNSATEYAPTLTVYKEDGTSKLTENTDYEVGTGDNAYKVKIKTAGKYYIGVKVGDAPEAKTGVINVTAAASPGRRR